MPIAPGTRLGPYAITAAIGAGGMGEVYRAHDTKLDRDVARGDGRELFYLAPDGMMMSVAVTPQPAGGLDFAAPVELFQTPLATPIMGIDQYAVTRDGQRFLVLRPRDTAAAVEQTINVVVNWQTIDTR